MVMLLYLNWVLLPILLPNLLPFLISHLLLLSDLCVVSPSSFLGLPWCSVAYRDGFSGGFLGVAAVLAHVGLCLLRSGVEESCPPRVSLLLGFQRGAAPSLLPCSARAAYIPWLSTESRELPTEWWGM